MKLASCIILILAIHSISLAGELEDRQNIMSLAANLYLNNKFETLNNLYKKYLDGKERTSSGLWKLTLLYQGIAGLADIQNKGKNFWNDMENKGLKWVDSYPQSPSGYIAYATILYAQAWNYRGTGFAHTVKKENWKIFHDLLEKTKNYLRENYEIASTDPHWYSIMIDISRGEGWDKKSFEEVFNEAVKRFPKYYPIYFAAALYLKPEWHGSHHEIEELAQRAVELTKHHDKTGLYVRVYWAAYSGKYRKDLFIKSNVSWEQMSKSIDDILEKYPDQWNINNFTLFACKMGDKMKAKSLFNMIEGEPIIDVWRHMDFYNHYKIWVATDS